MSEFNHSPAPWSFVEENGEWLIKDANGGEIQGNPAYDNFVPTNKNDWILQAAAPELLEALGELLNVYVNCQFNHENLLKAENKARAVIAKVRGK